MLEFKTTQELKPNTKLLELIKDFTYKTKKGKVKVLLNTNLQFIEPTEYLITYPIILLSYYPIILTILTPNCFIFIIFIPTL